LTTTIDVATAQRALDALISGDQPAAADQFAEDIVLTGFGGCLAGRAIGLAAVLARFADMSRRSDGTFGTEVEAVYTGEIRQFVVISRHWAAIDGEPVHGSQALVVGVTDGRIQTIDCLSQAGPASGIWD
jgi:ketosteroid isomerase-like protein